MMLFFKLCVLFLVSYFAYRLFERMKFPASRLVGPIIAVAMSQATGITFEVPSLMKLGFTIVFGVYLGVRFNRSSISQLKAAILPAVAISIIYIGITMIYGYILTTITAMDEATAFLSVIPGGVAEAGILSASYDADLAQITTFQLVRFLTIVLLVPLLSNWFLRPKIKSHRVSEYQVLQGSMPVSEEYELITADSENRQCEPLAKHPWLWLFAIGGIGSLIFTWINFPAAPLLGATFLITFAQLLSKKSFAQPPSNLYNIAQIGMGAVIGTSFTLESLQAIGKLMFPLLVITFLILFTSLCLGWLFSKCFRMDFMTGFMSVLPGGLSAMIVLGEAYDADIVMISSLQMVRLITAIMVIPIIYQFLL